MHMADALLSPAVGASFWALSVGGIAYSVKKLKEKMDEKMIPLMGVMGAFVFAAQMINFTIPATGSSGHLGGGLLLSILLGPYAGFIVMASVLTIQAFFFADGGLLALGCNIWNLGFYTSFIAYPLIYKPLTKGGKNIFLSSLISAVIGLQLGALSVVLQTYFSGITELPFNTFLLLMQPIHLAIGVVEGIVTAGIVRFIYIQRPELFANFSGSTTLSSNLSLKKVISIFIVLTVVVGGVFSWFASNNPDGLEWAIEKTYGNPELPEKEEGIQKILKNIQEKISFFPDYSFKKSEKTEEKDEEIKKEGEKYPNVDMGTTVSGVLGSFLVLIIVLGTGFVIRSIRKKST